jgi:hypothetical protein
VTTKPTDPSLITETQTALLLGMTAPGVKYVAKTGRLSAHLVRGVRHYDLDDVQRLRAHREAHPRRGRPSALAVLQRRAGVSA